MGRFGAPTYYMDLQHGFGLFFIGITLTLVGFFTAYIVINLHKKHLENEEIRKREAKKNPYNFGTGNEK
tara:strand:- start:228 stop:434 length:207 start_codon:yes stop_codon:yes gene_type:complete